MTKTLNKDCFEILLEKELENDYEYRTTHKDELSEIHNCCFSEYDEEEYEVCWNDTYYKFDEEIETTNCIGEFETMISDELSEIFYSLDSDTRKKLERNYCIHSDEKRKSNILVYQATNGHYYIKKK